MSKANHPAARTVRDIVEPMLIGDFDVRQKSVPAFNGDRYVPESVALQMRRNLDDSALYAATRDALLDDARKACAAAEMFMRGFEDDHDDGNDRAVREPLRKLRAVLAYEAAEKAPGAPGDVDAMRKAIAARAAPRVVIEVRGGNVQSVYAWQSVDVEVLDFDNADAEDNEDERDEDCSRAHDATAAKLETASRELFNVY